MKIKYGEFMNESYTYESFVSFDCSMSNFGPVEYDQQDVNGKTQRDKETSEGQRC